MLRKFDAQDYDVQDFCASTAAFESFLPQAVATEAVRRAEEARVA